MQQLVLSRFERGLAVHLFVALRQLHSSLGEAGTIKAEMACFKSYWHLLIFPSTSGAGTMFVNCTD